MGLLEPRVRKRKPSVRQTWDRLRRWFATHLPEVLDSLNRGATQKQIRQLESLTRRPLPDDLRESLQIHNGESVEWIEKDGVTIFTGCIFGLQLLSADRIADNWEVVRRADRDGAESKWAASCPEGAVQLCESHPGWIPLTCDGSGNHLGVDLAPGLKGTWGQVITFGPDDPEHCVAANSWGEFLADVADDLEAGNYTITEEQSVNVRYQHFGFKDPFVGHLHQSLVRRHIAGSKRSTI